MVNVCGCKRIKGCKVKRSAPLPLLGCGDVRKTAATAIQTKIRQRMAKRKAATLRQQKAASRPKPKARATTSSAGERGVTYDQQPGYFDIGGGGRLPNRAMVRMQMAGGTGRGVVPQEVRRAQAQRARQIEQQIAQLSAVDPQAVFRKVDMPR
jgi:hypothetical protein